MGVVERIFTRPAAGAPAHEQRAVRVVADAGIEGDRYFGRHDEPGQNITFVEAEELESFYADQKLPADHGACGRNIVTRGVRLNRLVGAEFSVGGLRFRGVELCEPCLGLGQALATPQLAPANVVKRLVHRAGLRADALSSGTLAVGAEFQPGPERTASMQIDGACHCGQISFSALIDPDRVLICHCTDCQVLSGAPFRAVAVAPMDSFTLNGNPKSYIKVAQSGNRRAQVFCPECGTPLFATAPENATSVVIRLGCVKQRAELKPSAQIWHHSALPWVSELAGMPAAVAPQGPAAPTTPPAP